MEYLSLMFSTIAFVISVWLFLYASQFKDNNEKVRTFISTKEILLYIERFIIKGKHLKGDHQNKIKRKEFYNIIKELDDPPLYLKNKNNILWLHENHFLYNIGMLQPNSSNIINEKYHSLVQLLNNFNILLSKNENDKISFSEKSIEEIEESRDLIREIYEIQYNQLEKLSPTKIKKIISNAIRNTHKRHHKSKLKEMFLSQ